MEFTNLTKQQKQKIQIQIQSIKESISHFKSIEHQSIDKFNLYKQTNNQSITKSTNQSSDHSIDPSVSQSVQNQQPTKTTQSI